jgi:ribosome-associated heat shock protein Hsp15
MDSATPMTEPGIRLDKWLWAARFFKTRALASAAVSGGKVHCAGSSLKPSRAVKLGDCLEIRRGFERHEIIVTGLSEQRGPATSAQLLYRETEASVVRRAAEAEKRKLAMMAHPHSAGRPDKKQRRQIRRFIDKD